MHFNEAKEKFRELEAKFYGGEITEDEFLDGVAQLRVRDEEGREWIISARNGRWLVHDGQQWVFAEPPQDTDAAGAPAPLEPPPTVAVPREPKPRPEPVSPRPRPARPEPKPERPQPMPQAATQTVVAAPKPEPEPRTRRRIIFPTSRVLAGVLTALLVVGCLVGAGVSAWVLFLRDLGEPEGGSVAAESTPLPLIETYTPRPATSTYTPTPTPTPSRTPTPTNTPRVTNTVQPSPTRPASSPTPAGDEPSASPPPEASPLATSTTAPAQTYTVKAGETLSEIAARFGVSSDELAEANGITNPALVRAGQVLVIPSPATTPGNQGPTPTPTWTPIVLTTADASPTGEATSTPTPTSTQATDTPTATPTSTTKPTPEATAKPTRTPAPTPTPTSKPAALSGKIAFTVWNAPLGKYELYVSNIDGSGRNRLGQGFRQPQFRQDGNMLAVNGDGAPNFEHLVKMNPSGGEMVEISEHTEDAFPSWSPDGAIVAFSSTSWGDGISRVGIVHDLFGKNWDWIPIGMTEIQGDYPFWMPDGRVVYHGCAFLTEHAACGLYWVGAGGGEYHRLTTDNSDTAPAGHGSRVAFMSARDGNWEVYTVNMDAGGLNRLTNNAAQDGLPTWSPDGKSIAFVSNRSGAWAIWVMDANGGNQRKLFDLGGGYGSGEHDWTRERISWAP